MKAGFDKGRQRAVVIGMMFLLVSGCANNAQNGAVMGGLAGGMVGAFAGPSKNQEQWALIGAGTGSIFGYMMGNEMDKGGRRY